ncbi:MAG: hypothetical protein HEP71_26330 [Roseivirga sp.]|nr:hypothetical protein [Roseivirga sp.]
MRSFIILLAALCCSLSLVSQDLDPGFDPTFYARPYVTHAVFDNKGTTYFTGDYDRIYDQLSTGITKLGNSGSNFDTGSGFNGSIFRLLIQSNNKLLVVGDFTEYNGVATGPMVSLNEDGSLNQSFFKATNITSPSQSPISNVIELANGKLLVYGEFTSYNGFATNSIVILNQDGTVDDGFSHQEENVLAVSQAAAQSSGKVVLALNRANSQPGLIARLNVDGTKDETFNDFDTGTNAVHKIMAQSTDKLLVLSDAPESDQPNVDLIRLNADGTSDDSFDLGTGIVGFFDDFQLEVDDSILIGTVSAGEEGGSIDGNLTGLISRIGSDGTFDKTFVSLYSDESSKVALNKNYEIFLYGNFSRLGNHYSRGIAKFADVDEVISFPRFDINSIAETMLVEKQSDNALIIPFFEGSYDNSTYFKSISNQWDWIRMQAAPPFTGEEIRVVKKFPDGSVAYGGGPAAPTGQNLFFVEPGNQRVPFLEYGFNDNWVNDVEMTATGGIYVAGSFSGVQGQTDGLAGILGPGLDVFTSPFSADSVKIMDIELQEDGNIVVAGVYSPVGETSLSNGVARLNADGSFDETFDRSLHFSGGIIEKIEIVSDGYIVAGDFTGLNSPESRRGVAKINLDGTLNTEFNGDNTWVGNKVYHVVVEGDAIYLGGDFTAYQGQAVSGLIKLDLEGNLDEDFKLPNTLSALVRDFEVFPDDEINIVMAGKFYDSALGRKLSAVRLGEDIDGGPIDLTADDVSNGIVTLSWQESSTNEERYILERSKNDEQNFAEIGWVGDSTTVYKDDRLYETGITYYYRVRAAKGDFRSEYSNVVEVEVPQRPLAPPTDLYISYFHTSYVGIDWKESSLEEDGFSVERSENDQQNFVVIDSVSANTTHFQDNTVEEEASYFYRVKTYKGEFSSEYSNIVAVQLPPSIPSNMTATLVSPNRIDLTWTDNSDSEDSFLITRHNHPEGFVTIGTAPANQTTYSDTSFELGLYYVYYVLATNSGGSSTTTSVAIDTKLAPLAPGNLTGTVISVNQIDLSWTDNSDNEENFIIARSVNNEVFETIGLVSANETSYSDTDVEATQSLQYKVWARNSGIDSPASNLFQVVISSIGEELPGQDSRFDFSYDPLTKELSFRLNSPTDKIKGYQVVSGSGAVTMREEGLKAQQLNLSMSGNVPGIYLLHVTSERDKYVVKFITKY